MGRGVGIRELAWFDCAGGGQIVVDGSFAYLGHMEAPHGTSVVDVTDPLKPKTVAAIDIPPGLHSHKVRVANGIMLVNRERHGGGPSPGDFVGLRIFDVADPHHPREIARWSCHGMGVHRFTFDGRYAYISPEIEGYVGNIVMILDLVNPARPTEVGRWWIPGQWTPPAAKPRPGKAGRIAAIIRSGVATGFTSATGMAAR